MTKSQCGGAIVCLLIVIMSMGAWWTNNERQDRGAMACNPLLTRDDVIRFRELGVPLRRC